MNLSVINKEGQSTGRTVSLPESIFEITPNEHAVYLDVKHHLANQRQGTHDSTAPRSGSTLEYPSFTGHSR